jgi:hypothetical protein
MFLLHLIVLYLYTVAAGGKFDLECCKLRWKFEVFKPVEKQL